jgi:site-specific recombinase XerD
MTNYPTVRLVFDRKHQATKKKLALVQLEVTYQRKRKYFSTGIRLFSDQWKDGKVIRNIHLLDYNESLQAQYNRVITWINELSIKDEEFTFDKLARFMADDDDKKIDNFIEYAENKINSRADLRISTKKMQLKLINVLKEYGKIKYMTDLNRTNIIAFDNWLHDRNYVQATVQSYHKTLKTYVYYALNEELIDKNPYQGIKIDRGKSRIRKYLTQPEIDRLAAVKISLPTLDKVRDLFLFQVYTGMAYAELAKFDFSKVIKRDGKYVVHDTRKKTDEDFYIVLLSPAIEILQKYNFKLPVISNQQYNIRLKLVAELAEINVALSSHMARHTFAVWCLNNGCQIETLAEMMGHSNIQTTQIYAKVLNESVEKEFDRLENLLKHK